jgi:hypothetical protein
LSSWSSALIVVVAAIALWPSEAQQPATDGFSLTTGDRLEDPGWWPTKGEAARNQYVGTETCKGCHSAIAALQETTPMYHAGVRARQSEILKKHEVLTLQEGDFRYSLSHTPDGVFYSSSNGVENRGASASWAFGAGEIGQTYLFEKMGVYTEARVSYFTSLNSLDITPGQTSKIPEGIEESLGNRLDSSVTRLCFGCHTTAAMTSAVFEPEKAVPGVTCEACHGPGARHVIAMKAQQYDKGSAAIANPVRLSPSDSVDFCGACHRTWADVAFGMPSNIGAASLRFQPFRLGKSRCWGKKGDARITCIACHDPHQPLVRDLTAYDSKCLACHSAKGNPQRKTAVYATCKEATNKCVSCHMPKYEVPQTHATFTDHYIRVVPLNRIGAPFTQEK